MQSIREKCHCGNISYELEWPETGRKLRVRACGCSFCTKHGGVYTSHPAARLTARVTDPSVVNEYTFGTETATFYICARCGAVPFVTSIIEERTLAVVNVNTFEDLDSFDFDASATDFDGEDLDGRLERRKSTWIQHVNVETEHGGR